MSGVLMRWWALALYQNNMVIMFLQFYNFLGGGGGGGGGNPRFPLPSMKPCVCIYAQTYKHTYTA